MNEGEGENKQNPSHGLDILDLHLCAGNGSFYELGVLDLEFNVVFQNEHFVVVDKPHGWLTTPARDTNDPRPCLGRRLQEVLALRLFPVHRLDFEVAGLVIFALTSDAHRESQKWFEHGSVGKIYQACTLAGSAGMSPREPLEWNSRLVRGKKRAFEAQHGKPARTLARVLRENPSNWLWELQPLTGRSHQLRFEMAKHAFPILGDTLYGGAALVARDTIALKAVRLDFSRVTEVERFGLPLFLEIAGLDC